MLLKNINIFMFFLLNHVVLLVKTLKKHHMGLSFLLFQTHQEDKRIPWVKTSENFLHFAIKTENVLVYLPTLWLIYL